MATLIFIRDAKDAHLLLLGIDEEGESARYTVNRTVYAELGSPPRGAILDSETFCAIKYADESYRARKKALSLLSFADNNERGLVQKLCRAGIRRDIAEEICREMVGLGYINEERQLERLIIDEANKKLNGPLKIIPRLASKGYSTQDIRSVMARLTDEGAIDFKESARTLLAKKCPDGIDSEEKKKLLYKYGYKIC